MDDAVKGHTELIPQHGINEQVMGATTNKNSNQKATLDEYGILQWPMASPSQGTRSTQLELLRSKSISQENSLTNANSDRSRFSSYDMFDWGLVELPKQGPHIKSTSINLLNTEGSLINLMEEISVPTDGVGKYDLLMLPSVEESMEDLPLSFLHDGLQDLRIDRKINDQLQQTLLQAKIIKHEAYEETCRRQKAERDVLEAICKVKASENLHAKEVKHRKDIEVTLINALVEVEELKSQKNDVSKELQEALDQKLALANRITDLEETLSATESLLNTLIEEQVNFQQKVDDAVREADKLRREKEEVATSTGRTPNFLVISYTEILQMTQNLADSLKIGEGRYGSVYKGFLRSTPVAIKMLHHQSIQDPSEFHHEVNVLNRMRHPNLVTLIGACTDAGTLVYEFLPNGSLEDRLLCKDNTAPLPWHVRIRIAAEICSALIFLHSNEPSMVHGNLKPTNILLDTNFVSKLGDFGILLNQSNTDPDDTSTYMDPQFLTTGELTPWSDIYSFGIILLCLLTGKPAMGIAYEVKEALETENLSTILDALAGDWPFVQAQQLAHLGLRCCEMTPDSRPDLVGEVLRVLDPMKKLSLLGLPRSSWSGSEDNSSIPSYFICPILQEIMKDPHVAADGFTYELDAIKGWLESSHDTSPMTNLKLHHCDLIPSLALRSNIQEWLQQQQ